MEKARRARLLSQADGADLVPPKLRQMYMAIAAQRAAEDDAIAALVGPPALPRIANTYYTTGGCWNLALALHERTGLPIELYVRADGKPAHGYVVNDEDGYAIDARGRIPIQQARAGASESPRVTPDELLELLDTLGPVGEFVREPDSIEHADRATEIVLDPGRTAPY